MTKEENLKWLDVEIRTWESECQSKHPIKEALYAARKALKQEPTLEKDGTLIVTTEHYKNVGRVLVQCGTNGALFYQDQDPTTKNDIRDNRVKNELNRVKDELEPTTKNCESCRYYGSHHEVCNYCYKCSLWTEQEPTTKNDLDVEKTDMIDKSNFSQEQYKTDLQSAYDSGYEQAKNDLEVDWESYKDVDGNSLDDLILEVLQNNFDCGNTYGYKVADEIIGLLPSVTPQEPTLDKIRAEIEEIHLIGYATVDGKRKIASRAVMQIIDKCMAESEG